MGEQAPGNSKIDFIERLELNTQVSPVYSKTADMYITESLFHPKQADKQQLSPDASKGGEYGLIEAIVKSLEMFEGEQKKKLAENIVLAGKSGSGF